MQTNRRKPLFTKSAQRNAAWYSAVLIIVYLIFNLFTILQLNIYFKSDIDVSLRHELEHIVLSISLENNMLKFLYPNEFEEPDLLKVTENPFFLQVFDKEKNILFRSKNLEGFQKIPFDTTNFKDEFYFSDINLKYSSLRAGVTKIYDSNHNLSGYIQLSTPSKKIHAVVEKVIFFNIFTLPAVFLIFIIISLLLAKRSLNPINKIIDLANEISAANLEKRLDYSAESTDELGRLKHTLNELFNRLEFQIEQISHFSDNASHQLMTPLTSMNTELDYILKREHSTAEYIETLNVIKKQTTQMINIIKTLLILAKDNEGISNKSMVFNLSHLVEEKIKKNYKNENIVYNVNGKFYLRGNSEYFIMVIQNLLDNAIKYSGENKEITLTVEKEGKLVKLIVADNGIGIPDADKEKVFERFFRRKISDDNGIKGYGLGLSLVSSVVAKMDGRISIENNIPSGTKFIIELPSVELI